MGGSGIGFPTAVQFKWDYDDSDKFSPYLYCPTSLRAEIKFFDKNTFLSTIITWGSSRNTNVFGVYNNVNGVNVSRVTDWSFRSNVASPNVQSFNGTSNQTTSSPTTAVTTNVFYVYLPEQSVYNGGMISKGAMGNYSKVNGSTPSDYPQYATTTLYSSNFLINGKSPNSFNGNIAEIILYNTQPLEYDTDFMRILHNQIEYSISDQYGVSGIII